MLVTANVNSLYTIINHEEEINATKWALNKFLDLKMMHKNILECLDVCLSHNYGIFCMTPISTNKD